MVSAMRELFVSPMKRVRKEITPHIQTRILVIGYLFSLFFFFSVDISLTYESIWFKALGLKMSIRMFTLT